MGRLWTGVWSVGAIGAEINYGEITYGELSACEPEGAVIQC